MADIVTADLVAELGETPALAADLGDTPEMSAEMEAAKINIAISVETATVDSDSHLILTLTDGTVIDCGYVKGDTGATGATGAVGATGATGATGKAGVSVQSAAVDSNGYLIVTLSDGTAITAGYVIGAQGERGLQGERGEQGIQGIQGERGETGQQGIQGIQGERGERGETGATGATGAAGYTPVKGVDYMTADDLAEIAESASALVTVPTKVSELENDSGYLTEHQSLAGYATTEEVTAAIDAAAPDLSGYATKADLDGKADADHTHSQYLTEHQSLTGYATEEYVDTGLSGKSDTGHTHDQYLTEHQSLTGYATETWVTAAINSAITEVENGSY